MGESKMADERTFDRRMSALLQQLSTLPDGIGSTLSDAHEEGRNEKIRTAIVRTLRQRVLLRAGGANERAAAGARMNAQTELQMR